MITRDPPTRTGCRQWYKCELSSLRQIQQYSEFYFASYYYPEGTTLLPVFHNTLIRNLVRANDDGADHVAVHGIMIDRGLSGGTVPTMATVASSITSMEETKRLG